MCLPRLRSSRLIWGLAMSLLVSLVGSDNENDHMIVQDYHRDFQAGLQAPMNQDEARQLSHYMMQYGPLNLANINDRSIINKPKIERTQPINLIRAPPVNIAAQQQQQQHQNQQHHTQLLVPASTQKRSDHQRMVQLDQQVSRYHNHNQQQHHQNQASSPIGLKKLVAPLVALPQNCISRAQPLASTCEDRLIKRLSQDATEGRTVIDVSRRVCCALFFHKECVESQILKVCPDSNPSAADLLMGSRNLDLTMSCQRFNRDGCNTGHHLAVPELWVILSSLIATLSVGLIA